MPPVALHSRQAGFDNHVSTAANYIARLEELVYLGFIPRYAPKTHQPAPPDRILVKAQVRYFVTSTDPKRTTNNRGPQAPKTHQPAPPDRILSLDQLVKAQVWQFA